MSEIISFELKGKIKKQKKLGAVKIACKKIDAKYYWNKL